MKAGDHLKLWNGKTAEILSTEPGTNQKGIKCIILRLYKAGTMVVKTGCIMTMHYQTQDKQLLQSDKKNRVSSGAPPRKEALLMVCCR